MQLCSLPQHPSIHPYNMSSGLLPQGLMGNDFSLGLLLSEPVRDALERAGERTAVRQHFSVCLMSLKWKICISEKRHHGPLGPKKYKYFNNKYFQCLPPVTAPGYYFTMNIVLNCVCVRMYYRLLWLGVIFMWKVFLVICPLENYH